MTQSSWNLFDAGVTKAETHGCDAAAAPRTWLRAWGEFASKASHVRDSRVRLSWVTISEFGVCRRINGCWPAGVRPLVDLGERRQHRFCGESASHVCHHHSNLQSNQG